MKYITTRHQLSHLPCLTCPVSLGLALLVATSVQVPVVVILVLERAVVCDVLVSRRVVGVVLDQPRTQHQPAIGACRSDGR